MCLKTDVAKIAGTQEEVCNDTLVWPVSARSCWIPKAEIREDSFPSSKDVCKPAHFGDFTSRVQGRR
jgi:hypothetical protein